MNSKRYLIVNADDFGQSQGVNRGIIEAFEKGIVRSASMMVRWPFAVEAAAYARSHRELSVGLHVDLCEWECREGTWSALYEVVDVDDPAAVEGEVFRQVDQFRDLMGADPTHLDSHQHVHKSGPAFSIIADVARRLNIPLRGSNDSIKYCGKFYGQSGDGCPYPEGISAEALLDTIRSLPPGVTELGCHPGFPDDLISMYKAERAREVEVLCDPQIRAAISGEGIELCSFRDVSAVLEAGRSAQVA